MLFTPWGNTSDTAFICSSFAPLADKKAAASALMPTAGMLAAVGGGWLIVSRAAGLRNRFPAAASLCAPRASFDYQSELD